MEVAAADGFITCADSTALDSAESGLIGRLELAREYNNPPPIAHFLLRSTISCRAELSRGVVAAYASWIWCGGYVTGGGSDHMKGSWTGMGRVFRFSTVDSTPNPRGPAHLPVGVTFGQIQQLHSAANNSLGLYSNVVYL